jgi:uncharacterized protein GlcG (DUF336 family)
MWWRGARPCAIGEFSIRSLSACRIGAATHRAPASALDKSTLQQSGRSCAMLKQMLVAAVALVGLTGAAYANDGTCKSLPNFDALRQALDQRVHTTTPSVTNGGLDFNMWASIVDRDGVVCAVAFTGEGRGDQWPGSRVISAQKANTANSFSLDGLALSTANLYAAVQPGGSLFGLQLSNPVATDVAYGGNSDKIGTAQDPMTGKKIGGVNVFGGGLALYFGGKVVGAVGVSGDTSCADHNVAWRVRQKLGLDSVTAGVRANAKTGKSDDGIIFDNDAPVPPPFSKSAGAPVVNFHSQGGFGHPECGFKEVGVATGPLNSGSLVPPPK